MDRRLRVKEVAERLGVSHRTVWTLISSGELPAVRIGHTTGVLEGDIAEYIKRCRSMRLGRRGGT